jgi:putative heme transporter
MQQRKILLPLHIDIVISLFGLILFFFVLIIAADILIPITFSLVFSLFLYPLCKWLEKRGLWRWLSILISLLLIIALLVGIISLISGSLMSFSDDFPQMKKRTMTLVKSTQTTLEKRFEITEEAQLQWLNHNLDGFISSGGQLINGVIGSISSFFTYIFLIPIYTFFMMYYRHIFKGFINRIVAASHFSKAVRIEEQIITVIQKYITGLFTVILIIGVMNITGLLVIGIPHAIFFGALSALLTVIPYVGVFIGSLLPILYALVMKESLYYPLTVFIWFQIVQSLEGNFITPNIVGSQVSLNPLVAILALLVGASVWGVPGMILFTPLTAMLKVFLDNIPSLAPYGYLLSDGGRKDVIKPNDKKWWVFGKKKAK